LRLMSYLLSSAKHYKQAISCKPRTVSSLRLRLSSKFALWGLMGLALHISSQAQTSTETRSDFDKSFRELKRNDSLQFDFTTLPALQPRGEPPQWLVNILNFIGAIFQALGPLFYMIFWLGAGALIMAILYLLVTTLMAANFERRDKIDDDTPVPLYEPEQAQARILLEEIDALAAQGKYAEAVHTLLFRSIQDIDANRPNIIRRSLTSREIGGLTILTANARYVFSSIAAIVERSFFGGQDISKADFDTARADYVRLTSQSGQWARSNMQEATA